LIFFDKYNYKGIIFNVFLIKNIMKIKCSKKVLARALNIASKAVSPNNTLPVLNNILIKAEGKKVFFSATNLEIAINTIIEADVLNEGSITIPSKILTSYIGLLKEGDIELKSELGMSLSIKSTHSETKIKGIAPDEFPMIPKVEDAISFKIPSKNFKEAVEQVAFAASSNTARPVLTGVLFRVKKDELTMVATDSYRLSEKKLKLKEMARDDVECLVPARTTQELGRILDGSEDIEVEVGKNQILFRSGNTVLTSRLIEGNFPEYEKILPKETKTKCHTSVEDLVLAVKKVSLFVMETNNNIKMTVTNDGKMLVSTEETQVGEGRADVDVKVEGENNKVALNAQYLLDVLSSIGEDEVFVELVDKINPILLKPLKKTDYRHIIMPLKL